jgi:hypothetical protein
MQVNVNVYVQALRLDGVSPYQYVLAKSSLVSDALRSRGPHVNAADTAAATGASNRKSRP